MQFRSFVVIHPSPSRLVCRSGIQFVMVHNIVLVPLGGSEEAWLVKVDNSRWYECVSHEVCMEQMVFSIRFVFFFGTSWCMYGHMC